MINNIDSKRNYKKKDFKMIYLPINNKIKFNITTLNNKKLLEVVGQLENYDLKVIRYN